MEYLYLFLCSFPCIEVCRQGTPCPQPPSVVVWLDVSGRGSRECACFLVLSFPWTRNRLVESGQGRGTMNHARDRERGNKESLLPAPRCKPRLHSNPQSIDACAAAAREGEASREKFQTCMDLQNKFLPRRWYREIREGSSYRHGGVGQHYPSPLLPPPPVFNLYLGKRAGVDGLEPKSQGPRSCRLPGMDGAGVARHHQAPCRAGPSREVGGHQLLQRVFIIVHWTGKPRAWVFTVERGVHP